MPKQPVSSTMADIARACGVSIQTVSAVVNDRAGISDETRRRVRAVMQELDYQPNQHARTLRGYRNPMIGVIIPSITNPFFPELVRGVEDVARRSGHGLFLCNDDYEEQKALDYLGFIRANHASGLIAAPGIMESSPEIERQILALARRNVPIVLFGEHRSGMPVTSIMVDARAAVLATAQHLLDLGHRRIGIIAPPEGMAVSRERISDFQTAFATLGRPLDPALIVPGGFDMECGSMGAERLMTMADAPTAIIAANDLAAMGAIAWLQGNGHRVPDDVSVIGYDDIPFARVFQPSITTVSQPLYDMGAAAMTALIEQLEAGSSEPASDRNVWLAATLMVRQSTAPCRQQPAETGRRPGKKRKTARIEEMPGTPREETRDLEDNPP